MTAICTATAKSGRSCQALAIRWPYGVDGNPHLCAKHAPAHVREMRDALFAEETRRHAERLDVWEPECWAWDPTVPLDRIADEFGWDPEDFTPRFQSREEQALRIALAAWHHRRCAVCGFHDLRLVEDHDHDTGLIRGLLCRSCNGKEPHDDGLFRKYRERTPAQILDIRLRYWDPWHGYARPRDATPRHLDNHPAYALAAKLGERMELRMSSQPSKPRPPIPDQVFLAPSCGTPDEATLAAQKKEVDGEATAIAESAAGPATSKPRRALQAPRGARPLSGGLPSLGKRC